MTIERHGTKFDCVAFMREARDRISKKMATMSREEFRHWLRSYRYSDPVLQRLADEARSGNPRTATPLRRPSSDSPAPRRDSGLPVPGNER